MKWMRTSSVVSMLILAAGSGLLLTDYSSAQDDSPRLIARLGNLQGFVFLRPSRAHDWLGAEPHRPITHGDRLWVGDDSRAELHDGFEIDTPNLAFFTMGSDQRAVFLGTQPLEAHRLEPESTRLPTTAEPAANPVPSDSMARPESRTQAPDRSGPGVEADLPHNPPTGARPILPSQPPGDFPGDLPAKTPYEEGLERMHQRQTEKLLQRQERQRLRLEQKHQEKVYKANLPSETPQLERQHRKLEKRQAMLRDQLTRMQQQEKRNLRIVEKLRHSRKRVTRP